MTSKPTEGIHRREVLKRIGTAGAALPLLSWTHHPLVPVPQGEPWSPRALDEAQLETLLALAEQIVPETDTPGARGALVHQYIDYVVSEDEGRKAALLEALPWFDAAARDVHGRGFANVSPTQQVAILTDAEARVGAEGRAHFDVVKRLVIEGYYRSEVGMLKELGYEGLSFQTSFDGCQHPEHHAFSPVAQNVRPTKKGDA